MNDTIITALIMAFGSIICQILINRSNRDKRAREDHEKELDRAKKEAEKECNPSLKEQEKKDKNAGCGIVVV